MTDARTQDAEKTGCWTGTFLNGAIPELEARIAVALTSIRDAATAAERERACLILEKLRNERGEHSFSAIVLDQALAALRGGDHD